MGQARRPAFASLGVRMEEVVPRSAVDFDAKAWQMKVEAAQGGHIHEASPWRTLLRRRWVMPSATKVDLSINEGDEERASTAAAVRGTKSTIFEASPTELMERKLSGLKSEDSSSGDENIKPDFRAKYLGRLSYSRAWTPREQRPPQHQTVTIFDWDDTLLCTSFLNDNPRTDVRTQLRSVAGLAKELLTEALRKGHVFIITNALEGWVEHSAHKYMPELAPMFSEVSVISARSKFERHFPDRVDIWKVQAFLEVQRQLHSDAIANLISVGDSHFEMQAIHAMGRQFEEAVVKTVKFRERPLPEDLRRELELVLRDFHRIVEHPTSAKIGFERKRKSAHSPPLRPAPSSARSPSLRPVAKPPAHADALPIDAALVLGA